MKLSDILSDKVYIIAEMSANHAGDLDNALEIVHAAKRSGADCLKIQTYTADTLTIDCDNEYFRIKGGLWDGYTLHNLYKEAVTPWEWHEPIQKACQQEGIDFLSTPFDNTAVDFLETLDIPFYKIASFELVDIPLIEYVASKGRPIIMSCGMATPDEIQDALDACYRQNNREVALLKCCSEYPAQYSNMNLLTIADMQQRFQVPIGLSDHSMGSIGAVVGVSLGASIVEKHFCLSREIKNPDSAFSMEPDEFMSMVQDIRAASEIRGAVNYTLTPSEKKSTIFRRSLFAVKPIAQGETLSPDNIRSIRPGYGLKPKHYSDILGKTTICAIDAGTPLDASMIAGWEEKK